MGHFAFSILDFWNRPEIRILRAGAKLGAKALASASANADNERITPPELAELLHDAQSGDSNAQVLLAVHYAENRDLEKANYWLNESAEQGNEYALEIVDMLQGE